MYLYGICLYLYLYLIGFVKHLLQTSVFMLERGLGKVDRGGLWRAEKNAIEWKVNQVNKIYKSESLSYNI